MSDRSGGDGVWEDMLILVVVGAAVVYGYHKLKPKAVDWLNAHDVHVGNLAHHAGSLSLNSWVNVGAILIGVALLITIWRGVRTVRRRDRGKKASRKVW